MTKLKTIRNISDYYKEIKVASPKYPSFHIGRHEDNLATIKIKQQPVRHELYSISLVSFAGSETGIQINNRSVKFRMFIISPYKQISWDITGQKPNGIYFIFDHDFIRSNPLWSNFLTRFPFFKTDTIVTDDIPDDLLQDLHYNFEKIYEVYHMNQTDPFEIIRAYVHIILLLLNRHFDNKLAINKDVSLNYKIHSRFESLLLESLGKPTIPPDIRKASFYADNLNMHINHLNSTLKQLTGKTTSELIYDQIVHHAGLLIRQMDIPIKELASYFHFSNPTHFISFFKKHTGLTPKQYKLKFPV